MWQSLLVVVLGLSVAVCGAEFTLPPIPILTPRPGVQYFPGSSAPVTLEAYFDLNCPDSTYAWDQLKPVADHYGAENFNLVILQLALPYHRNGFMCAQAYHYIEDVQPDRLWSFMEIIFEHRLEFSESNNLDVTQNELMGRLGELGEEATGVPASQIIENIPNYRGQAVREWKYATHQGCAGTPWFIINGVNLELNPDNRVTYDEWIALLDPLMPAAARSVPHRAPSEQQQPAPRQTLVGEGEFESQQTVETEAKSPAKRLRNALKRRPISRQN